LGSLNQKRLGTPGPEIADRASQYAEADIGYLILVWPILTIKYELWVSHYLLPRFGVANIGYLILVWPILAIQYVL
jgi:hypothetical protein